MRILLRHPILSATQEGRYSAYLQDRLTGTNEILIDTIVVQDPPLVASKIVTETYLKNPGLHRGAWLIAGVASAALSIVPATLINRIPALGIRIPNPVALVEREPEIITVDLKLPTTKQVKREVNRPIEVSKKFEVNTTNVAGEFQADPVAISQVNDLIDQIVSDGGTITSSHFVSSSSDEWGPLSESLGLPNAENVYTSEKRADAVVKALTFASAQNGNDLGEVNVSFSEDTWTQPEVENFEALAEGMGFDSAQELYDAYKADRNAVPEGLAKYLDVKLGEQRGTNIIIKYTEPGQETRTVLVTVPDIKTVSIDIPVDNTPDPFDIRIFPILIPPLSRRKEKREELIPLSHEESTKDRAIIKLFPEAKTDKNTLRENAWRDTRKYDYLLKNDRIKYIHRFDYQDKNGNEQTLRIAFVDHVPSADALLVAVKVAQEAAQVQRGRVGSKLDLIALYPQDQTQNREPLDLGLGIDEKATEGVAGLAIPAIGLVEVQYDPLASYAKLTSADDFAHTLRHEILGHFTDLEEEKPTLHEVRNIPNGYTLNTPWKGVLTDLYRHHIRLELAGAPKTFDIVRSVEGVILGVMHSSEGELFDHSVVTKVPNDGSVVSVKLQRFTDEYAQTDPLEHWAQSVAYTFAEMPVDPSLTYGSSLLPAEVTARLGGYRPDKQVVELVHKTLGTIPELNGRSFPLDYQPRPDFTHIGGSESDPDFVSMVQEAKTRVLPKESDLINVVTSVRPFETPSLTIEPIVPTGASSEISSPMTMGGLGR